MATNGKIMLVLDLQFSFRFEKKSKCILPILRLGVKHYFLESWISLKIFENLSKCGKVT